MTKMEQSGKQRPGSQIIPTPTWVLVVRIFQIILSFVVIGTCGAFVHYLYADQLGFAIICCIFTWIISLYTILSEKVPACQKGYNTFATLALDGLMIVFWLAAMGAVAAYRGTFTVDVNASCTSDGSALNSGSCVISKRARVGVASKGALIMISAAAGVSALLMLLYVASFAYVCHYFRLSRQGMSSNHDTEKFGSTNGAVPAQTPLMDQPSGYPSQTQGYAQPQQQQYTEQQPYNPQTAYGQPQQPQFSQQGGVPYDPYVSQAAPSTHYTGSSVGYDQNQAYAGQYQQQQQPVYSAASTPAPGQIYQPPAH